MARTVRFARTLLPLPPYEVWVRAYLHDRGAFLEALDIEPVPVRSEPVLVDVRPVDESWMAELHLVRSGTEWRGFLRFSSGPEMSVGPADYRTAYIFRDGDVQELRRRFQEFTAATLASFLRSVSP